ncbi:uncharacterized protein LOC122265939 isoform X2 [Penaeus japonicus]|uniref:uncharacterized protein LOC122265939 isoform X1 n=1 Tax=Penaeus japonicus TaxID=27405 RepID=UPI001C70D6B1|nr:uncharacterized protein LOC122265939 isoform X1 [Penaeus japonicus]XP_042891383.1 uncharacterized protein LOC122265939 isoform X2 [Penaeus japonicus]
MAELEKEVSKLEFTYLPSPVLNPQVEGFKPESELKRPHVSTRQDRTSSLVDINVLREVVDILSSKNKNELPRPEPEVFSGDILEFPTWLQNFEIFIESRVTKPAEKLFYLGKYTSGAAKEAIRGLLRIHNEEAFREAKGILEDRYGNKFIVANAFRRKLSEWPKILRNDGHALQKFSDFLKNCLMVMKTSDFLNILDDPQENNKMLQKLTPSLIERWNSIVYRWSVNGSGYPTFNVFCEFIEVEAKKACHPISSYCAVMSISQKYDVDDLKSKKEVRSQTSRVGTKRLVANSTGVKESELKRDDKGLNVRKKFHCHYCNGEHDLDSCKEFGELSNKEKMEYVQRSFICRGCLKFGHIIKNCRKRKMCAVCKRCHPTSLHEAILERIKEREAEKTVTLYKGSTAEDNITSDKVSEEPKNDIVSIEANKACHPISSYSQDDVPDQALVSKLMVHKVTIDGEKKCGFPSSQTKFKEIINSAQISKFFELDFNEREIGDIHQQEDGHYELPLPLKDDEVKLPNSKELAMSRLMSLRGKLQSNKNYHQDYVEFMNELINKGYAEELPNQDLFLNDGQVWYIPHHGVYHPKKPGKIRVVFDCSATYKNESLNRNLLQDPDLTNNLIGVLCRFRKENVAVVSDIEAMFHQVKVRPNQRNLLRFLQWNNGVLYSNLIEYFSDWHRTNKAIALCLRLHHKFKKLVKGRTEDSKETKESKYVPPSVTELEEAEKEILRQVQNEAFEEEKQELKYLTSEEEATKTKPLKKGNRLYHLDPFLDKDGISRIVGRMRHANFTTNSKHPAILPKVSHITEMIVCDFHQKVHHQGRGITLNELRASGYWIIGGSTIVERHIFRCVTCKRLRGTFQEQKMSDLPPDRLEPTPPFTYSAVDYFGPFYVKEGRKEVKRYGVLFTCMVSRAIHIETANTLETDSFLNAYRRFIRRRDPVRQLTRS